MFFVSFFWYDMQDFKFYVRRKAFGESFSSRVDFKISAFLIFGRFVSFLTGLQQ